MDTKCCEQSEFVFHGARTFAARRRRLGLISLCGLAKNNVCLIIDLAAIMKRVVRIIGA